MCILYDIHDVTSQGKYFVYINQLYILTQTLKNQKCHMVQPTLQRQRLYKYWPKVSKNHRQMLPHGHPLRKICNRSTLKLSYSRIPNVATIISSHNKRLLAEPNTAIEDKCNCRKKETCPLLGKCQTKGVVYQATVKREENQEEQTYVGIA